MRRRSFVLSLIFAWFLSCATFASARANDCADGGRLRPDEGGIGGTGLRPAATGEREDEGGIGGTGVSASADTGIIGTITGFASICVGGVEIHYGADSPVDVDGVSAGSGELAVGQVVEVIASGMGSEVSARHISVRHVVAGPVTRVDAQRNEIEVVGQTVWLSAAVPTRPEEAETVRVAADFFPGEIVRVSGMRRGDGLIVASLVTKGGGEESRLTGQVTRVAPRSVDIGATRVDFADDVRVALGDEIRVTGRWDGNALVATSVQTIPPVPFEARLRRVEIEGYAVRASAGQVKVGAFLLDLPQSLSPESLPPGDAPVRVLGVVRDRRVVIERIAPSRTFPPSDVRGKTVPDGRSGSGDDRPPQENAGRPRGEPPPRDRPDSGPDNLQRQDVFGGSQRAPRAERPAPALPEAPPRPNRPPRPDRPPVPERPPRPERPPIPDRPDLPRRGRI